MGDAVLSVTDTTANKLKHNPTLVGSYSRRAQRDVRQDKQNTHWNRCVWQGRDSAGESGKCG